MTKELISLSPLVWTKAKPIYEELVRQQQKGKELVGFDANITLSDLDPLSLLKIMAEIKEKATSNAQLLFDIYAHNAVNEVLMGLFWRILDTDPNVDINANLYRFDVKERKLYFAGPKPHDAEQGVLVPEASSSIH